MRLTSDKALKYFADGDLLELGKQADAIRKKKFGDRTTFIIDRNINYTNTYEVGCEIQKKRLECAIYIQAKRRTSFLKYYSKEI